MANNNKNNAGWGGTPQKSSTGSNDQQGWGGTPQKSSTGSQGQQGWGGAPQKSSTGSQGQQGWGGAPQKSSTGSQGQQGWGGAPQKSNTGSQGQQSWGGAPQKSNTGAGQDPSNRFTDAPEYPQYEIDGIVYNMIRVISNISGEAKIIEIENNGMHYALKLYKPRIHPNHEVLERVMKLRGNGMLVDIYAHGVWTDKKTGIEHDFEIMEYCSGGSMASLKLTGDEKRMKEIVARMAATLDFAHSHGILHRDVKPANFLFTDESHTRFVLTDWGLAKILDKNGKAVTDEGRTKIYAAPEMYTHIPGKLTYLDAKADFFSMGMTLLALWIGEGLLTADEEELVKNKTNERLPYPSSNEMSEHLLSLLKALTRRDPIERAGLDEIAKWASGEIIYKDPAADRLSDFRIVFSAQKNLIAHSPKELGIMMWENRELGKDYLYGDLHEWLQDNDQPEFSRQIQKIKEELYPGNQDAGLFAAALLLNPETLYEGLDGNPLRTQEDVARELFNNVAAYKKALYRKKEHPLWAYLNAKKLGNRIDEFRKLINKNGEQGVLAIAYMLDPSLPFRFPDAVRGNGAYVDIDTLPELGDALLEKRIRKSDIFLGDDFLTWVSYRDPLLAGKAKEIAASGKWDDSFRADVVAYTIFPDRAFDFKKIGDSQKATPEQLAIYINPYYKVEEHADKTVTVSTYAEFIEPILAYLTARGKYDKQISWIRYCFDINSEDNKKKYIKYDDALARSKAAAGLYGEVLPLRINDVTFKTLDDVRNASFDGWSVAAMDVVARWVALFFQENPNVNYKQKSYFNLAADYFEFVYQYLHNCRYARDAKMKVIDINNAKKDFQRAKKKVTIVKWFASIFCLLPLLLVIIAGVYLLATQGASEIGSIMTTIGTWAGIIIGVIAGLAVVGETENLILGGIVGLICFAVVKLCLVFIAPAVPWVILGFFFIQLLLNGHAVFTSGFRSVANQYTNLSMSEGELRAEMAKAFNCRQKLLPSNLDDNYPENIYYQDAANLNGIFKSFVKKVLWLFVVTIGACAFCVWIYGMDPDKIGHEKPTEGVMLLDGSFSGNVKGTPLDVVFSKKDDVMSADMKIKYRSGNTVQTMKTSEGAAIAFPVVMAKEGDAAITLTIDTAYMEAGATVVTGSYLNSKGNRQPVNIKKK